MEKKADSEYQDLKFQIRSQQWHCLNGVREIRHCNRLTEDEKHELFENIESLLMTVIDEVRRFK